jgi:signal transduction histidine kinase
VADTGTGIPPENISKLFEPLFTTKSRGVGLGLAIVKSVIEAHGGTITVKSDVGHGSKFCIALPLRG